MLFRKSHAFDFFLKSHKRWQKEVRKFFDEVIFPEAWTKEEDGKRVSDAVIKAMADTNLIAARMGPGKHLQGRKLLAGVKPEEVCIDCWFTSILCAYQLMSLIQ